MANGLDAGDSIRGSDKFRFFRGWNTDQSAGERFVPMSDLVTYLNDPTVLSAVGGASTARVDNLEYNIGVNSLRDAVNGGYAYFNMVGGVGDVYTDETGVDTGAASNQVYNAAGDYYAPSSDAADLLLHFDGTDGDTTTTDDTGTHSPSFAGTGAEIDNAQSVFGGTSVFLNGTTGNITIPASSDWAFGTGDFTVDFRARYSGTVGRYVLGTGIGATQFAIDQQASQIRVFVGGARSFTVPTMSVDTWYHIAVTRSGNSLRLFVDGTESTTGAIDVTGSDVSDSATALTIGDATGVSLGFTGWMDELRISKGTAVWTTDFTVPAAAYSIATQSMTLPSIDFTTNLASVDYVRPVVLWEDITTGSTLNTDFILEVSRDSGTTWTAATLEQDAVFSGSAVYILVADEIDITSQPAGTTATYRIRTANGKNIRVHGVYLQWR